MFYMPHQIAGAYFITKYFHRREKLVFSDATHSMETILSRILRRIIYSGYNF